MKYIIFYLFFCFNLSHSQLFNLNQNYIEDYLRDLQLIDNSFEYSFTIKANNLNDSIKNLIYSNYKYNNSNLYFELLPIDLISEYTSEHPYNRNNGSMIPNKGSQSLVSLGFKFKLGFLEIILKPEYLYAENLAYEGFWDGHYPLIISKRLSLWNHIDLPERFGTKPYKSFFIGQSSFNLNFNPISISLSNENIWWGPAIRNSIMMSNNAKSFPHISIKSLKPIDIPLGSLDFQFITGKLSESSYEPSYSDFIYANHITYVPKSEDERFFQAVNFNFSPKFINGLTLGYIRWIQSYIDFNIKNRDYFPVFDNLIRKNDKYGVEGNSKENERDQAAGLYFRWLWEKSNAEFYAELYYNDSKGNFRDLLLDSDHARASTIGLQKIFLKEGKNNYYKFSWEWTQLEQSSSRLLREAGSWYMHGRVRHGYTNRGEVIGASIGPGSNSHYFGVTRTKNNLSLAAFFEIIDQDNDFLYHAFENAKDFRRYWKDYNFHLKFTKKNKMNWINVHAMYSRSINYQWALDESFGQGYDYYVPGIDKNNFFITVKFTQLINF